MRCVNRQLLVPVLVLLSSVAARAQTPDFGAIGRSATPEEIQAWSLAIGPEGQGLPPGKGSPKEGAPIWLQKCAMCHGVAEGDGSEAPASRVFRGGLATGPYATTLWSFIRRAMPMYAVTPITKRDLSKPLQPSGYPLYPLPVQWAFQDNEELLKTGVNPHLTFDEIYALTAYILYKSDVIKEDTVLDRETLPKVQMPGRKSYTPLGPDGKVPDWKRRDPAVRIEPHVSPNSKPLPAGSSPVNVVQ